MPITTMPAPEADVTAAELAPLVVADRCDRCGAQAFVRARLADGLELLFCGHHGREHTPKLVALGAQVRDDTHVINAKPSLSANAD